MSDDVFERTRRYTRTWRSCGARGGLCLGRVCCCRVDFFLLRVRVHFHMEDPSKRDHKSPALEQAIRYVPWNRVRCEPHRSSSLSHESESYHIVCKCRLFTYTSIACTIFLFTEGVRNIASARTARLHSQARTRKTSHRTMPTPSLPTPRVIQVNTRGAVILAEESPEVHFLLVSFGTHSLYIHRRRATVEGFTSRITLNQFHTSPWM